MKGVLIRIAIDMTPESGSWNGPYDPCTGKFVFVPIMEGTDGIRPRLTRTYNEIIPALSNLGLSLPTHLVDRPMHLDPDFEMLTYGDGWPRSKPLENMNRGDFIAFYAGLRSLDPKDLKLTYALIGFYRVSEVVPVQDVPKSLWHENAHTRRIPGEREYIIRAIKSGSGRLKKAIPIGEYRDNAYRVRNDLLKKWGGLSVNNGYLQRSATLPLFIDPERFLKWWDSQDVQFLHRNN